MREKLTARSLSERLGTGVNRRVGKRSEKWRSAAPYLLKVKAETGRGSCVAEHDMWSRESFPVTLHRRRNPVERKKQQSPA